MALACCCSWCFSHIQPCLAWPYRALPHHTSPHLTSPHHHTPSFCVKRPLSIHLPSSSPSAPLPRPSSSSSHGPSLLSCPPSSLSFRYAGPRALRRALVFTATPFARALLSLSLPALTPHVATPSRAPCPSTTYRFFVCARPQRQPLGIRQPLSKLQLRWALN